MKFKDAQEAITFGKTANVTDVLNLIKARTKYNYKFEFLMTKDMKTMKDFNRLQVLATHEGFCNAALNAVGKETAE